MTTFREKYDYWIDRQIGEYIYRFHNEFEIHVCPPGEKNFHPAIECDNPADTRRAWRKLCDRAADNVGQASSRSIPAKEPATHA